MAKNEHSKVNLYNLHYKDNMQPIDWTYYTKFYPEKAKAIQMLRLDTGLDLKRAKDIIDEIFAKIERGEIEPRKANKEFEPKRESLEQKSCNTARKKEPSSRNKEGNLYTIRYKNSMQPIDWVHYTKFYPEKTKAIQMLRLDTGLGLKEAKDVVDEIFSRLERGEVEQRKPNAEYDPSKHPIEYNDFESSLFQGSSSAANDELKAVGKGIGCGCFTIVYFCISLIFKLAGIGTGRKSRRKRW